jgi:hypothetical protein
MNMIFGFAMNKRLLQHIASIKNMKKHIITASVTKTAKTGNQPLVYIIFRSFIHVFSWY